jgi:hypothetical protein
LTQVVAMNMFLHKEFEVLTYSRWFQSSWYVFWHTDSGDTLYDQKICIHHARGDEKVLGVSQVLEAQADPDPVAGWSKIFEVELSAIDVEELDVYLCAWLEDINKEFAKEA